MKRIILLVALISCCFQIGALEVGTRFYMGNMAFADERTADEVTPSLGISWGGSIDAFQPVNDQLGVNLSFESDPTLNFVSYTLLDYKLPFFAIVGPFFGFFNSRNTILKPEFRRRFERISPASPLFPSAPIRVSGDAWCRRVTIFRNVRTSPSASTRNAISSINLITKSYIYRTDEQRDHCDVQRGYRCFHA